MYLLHAFSVSVVFFILAINLRLLIYYGSDKYIRIEFMYIGYTLSTFIVFAYLSDVWLLYFDFHYLFTYYPKKWYMHLLRLA